jgi:Ca2+-binding EF-hand superfamily protein
VDNSVELKNRPNYENRYVQSSLVRGGLERKSLRKSLLALSVPELRGSRLTQFQADKILSALDGNGDGIISAREFKHW